MTALVKYEEARQALACVASVDEAKNIRDQAEALQAYARQRDDVVMEKWVAEIKLRATVRIGEISRELDKAKHGGSGGGSKVPAAGRSKSEVLKAAGISTSSAHRAEKLAENKESVEKYIADKAAKGKPVKITEAIAAVTRQAAENKAKQELQKPHAQSLSGLYVGDFRDFAKEIADESVELIFTDPPYDRESIPLFEDLARIAERVLKPGGSVIAYCGQIQLPDVLRSMSQHLRYWWVNACVHSGGSTILNKYGIKNKWKPMVWFVKKTRGDVQTFVDDSVSGGKEKAVHEWQQSQSEAEYYIEKLSSKDGLVWEPFAGGGTTIAACESLKRKWIACELNHVSAGKITKRIRGEA